MKDGTVKLSGHVKDRFLERFIADEPSLSPDARDRLAARARSTFTSIRVRKAALRRQREMVPTETVAPAAPPEQTSTEHVAEPERAPAPAPDTATTAAPEPGPPATPAAIPLLSSTIAHELSPAAPPTATPQTETPQTETPATPAPPAVTPAATPASAFDAYAVKLVPVFQREGRDGLLARLADVGEVGDLRRMAKAQQIILPEGLRIGEASAEAVRAAIADAVARRIADRRAAAG